MRWVVAAALVMGLGGGACARATGAGSPEDELAASPSSAIRVRVANHNWLDVDVYAVREGTKYRLGTVTSMTAQVFRLPSGLATPSGDFQLLVDPIGSNEVFVTEPLLVAPGQLVDWSIENHLALSSYRVF